MHSVSSICYENNLSSPASAQVDSLPVSWHSQAKFQEGNYHQQQAINQYLLSVQGTYGCSSASHRYSSSEMKKQRWCILGLQVSIILAVSSQPGHTCQKHNISIIISHILFVCCPIDSFNTILGFSIGSNSLYKPNF